MPFTRVQFSTGQSHDGSGNITIAWGSHVIKGNLLVALIVGTSAQGIASFSDSLGNTWTNAGLGPVPEAPTAQVFFCLSQFSGADSFSCSITTDQSSNSVNGVVAEYSSLSSPSLDFMIGNNGSNASGTGVGSSINTGGPTDFADEVIIAFDYDQNQTAVSWVTAAPFLQQAIANNSTAGSLVYSDLIVTAIGSYAASWTGAGIVTADGLLTGLVAITGSVTPPPPNTTKLEISLMGTKRYGKMREPVCTEARQPKPVKLFETE